MLQPKNPLMKRGSLLGREPREDRKVFAAVGFLDFAAGISAVFMSIAPLPFRNPKRFFYVQCVRRLPSRSQFILSSTDPKHMAVIKACMGIVKQTGQELRLAGQLA